MGSTEFGAILDRVPPAGGQWSTDTAPPARRSTSSSLLSYVLIAAILAGGWFGFRYWNRNHAPLTGDVAAYVNGPGVDYVSPVTGVGGNFGGAPVETQLVWGAPAAVFSSNGVTMIVAAFPGPVTEQTLVAASAPYAATSLRTNTATVGSTVYAVVVGAPDARSVDAIYERFAESLRLPGGATI